MCSFMDHHKIIIHRFIFHFKTIKISCFSDKPAQTLTVVKQVITYKNIWKMMYQRVLVHSRTLMSSGKEHMENCSKRSRMNDNDSLRSGFKMLDADFFSDDKMLEIEKSAKEVNIPIIKSNRKLVSSTYGGLENPSCLTFNSAWNHNDCAPPAPIKFNYPFISDVERPTSDEDIAFMSILELG